MERVYTKTGLVLSYDTKALECIIRIFENYEKKEAYINKMAITNKSYSEPYIKNYFYSNNFAVLGINHLIMERCDTEEIIIRNKIIKFDEKVKELFRKKWGKDTVGSKLVPHDKDDRLLKLDLKKHILMIEKGRGRKTESLNLLGISINDIQKFIRKKFFYYQNSVIILDEKFYHSYIEMIKNNSMYKWILKLSEEDILHGNTYPNRRLAKKYFRWDSEEEEEWFKASYLRQSEVSLHESQKLAGMFYVLNNPGLESVVKSDYHSSLYTDIFFNNRSYEKTKLCDALNVKNTTLKMISFISEKFCESISEMGSKCNKTDIKAAVCEIVCKSFNAVEDVMTEMNGYNNVQYFLECYFENQFYIDFLKRLNFFYNSNIDNSNIINQIITREIQYMLNIFREISEILKTAPEYLNNIHGFSAYFANICHRQGISNIANAIKLQNDYIKVQKRMNARWEKYPTSIMLSHDIAHYNYEFWQLKKSELAGYYKKFVEQVKKYTDLDYIDKNEKFIVTHPCSIEDMFIEGCSLNHCVASYIPEVANKRSKIMFIRKKEESETPYFTVEIQKNKILQVKGMAQCDPKDESLLAFIKRWAQMKDLKLHFHF